MPVDARPTIAAPDDDPYLWLEEIDGERAVAWVDQQNGLTLAKFGTREFAEDRDTLAAILDRPDNIPFVTRRGPYLYNIWKDAKNPRGLWRRTTLDSFRTAAAGLGDHPRRRCARDGRERGLGVARRLDPAGLARPGDPVAVTRRQRRRRAARVRHRRQGVRERRLRSARGEGRHRLARPRHPPVVQRLRQGHGHQVRLPANGAALAARVGRRSGAGADRDDAREHGPLGSGRSHARTGDGLVRRQTGLLRYRPLARRPHRAQGEARPADGHRAREPRRLDGGEAPHGVDHRRQDLRRRYAARHRAVGFHQRKRAISRCCSNRPNVAPCSISSGAKDS